MVLVGGRWRLALLLLTGLSLAWAAQALAEERAEVVALDAERLSEGVILSRAWRYHPGDDPVWAEPAHDDSSWALVEPALHAAAETSGGWPGIGWFRRRVRVAAEVGEVPLGMYLVQAGASEIYVDGRLVARYGTVSRSVADERPMIPQYVASITLAPAAEHVIAVRYSNATDNVLPRDFRGFHLTVGEMKALTAIGIREIRGYTAAMAGTIGLFGAFAILHLLLFLFHPKAVENLLFALFTGSVMAMFATEVRMNAGSDLTQMLVSYKLVMSLAAVMALSALLLELRLSKRRVGWSYYLLLAAGGGVTLWAWTRPVWNEMLPVSIFVAVVLLATLYLAVLAVLRREPEAWVVGLGFVMLTLGVLANMLQNLRLLELPWLAILLAGYGTPVACISVYLSRRVARVNRELEAKLQQVEELTAKTIEQERWAAEEEAERRLLEADNERKTAELEEARELQLEMLPEELPRLGAFDFAVRMTTANEVGGDYYDFAADGNGGCTLAVGDATGHGLQAGMVVAVVKSLFQTAAGEARLSKVLRRIDAGLRTIRLRAASMSMALVRLDDHRLRVASAGMPPVLVWRRASGELEELMLPGAPLGTALANGEYRERQVELESGDAALIMTDGLVEATNPDGETLGYDRAASLFREAASLEPEAIIDRLVTRVQRFLGGTPLGDDMTLLVLKASG